jgi:tetratricopeptide (TPR) repeat protein
MFRFFLIATTALAAASYAQGPAAPQPDAAQERAFQDGLRSVNSQMGAGKFVDAQSALRKLLETHEGRDYACAKRTEIAENLKRCAFRVAYPPPEPKNLVQGELLFFDRSSGRIKIRYKSEATDFISYEKVRQFPALFNGPHSIEIKGARYPGSAEGAVIIVCAAEDEAYMAYFGYPPASSAPGTRYVSPQLLQRSSTRKLDFKERSTVKDGKPFVLKVDVLATSITASYNGMPVLRGTKPAKHWGALGYFGVVHDEMTVEGKIEPTWLQHRIDEIEQQQMQKFEATFDQRREVPQWLFEAPKAAAAPLAALADYPGRPNPAQVALAGKLEEKIEAGEAKAVAERLAAARDDLPETLREFILAQCASETGDSVAALAHCDRVLAGDPSFHAIHYVRARILSQRGKVDDAIKAFEAIIAVRPADPDAYVGLVFMLLEKNRAADAKRALERAIKSGATASAGPSSKVFDQLGGMLDKAVRGPSWARTHESKSSHYHVCSDMDRETCVKAAQMLEDALIVYSGRLRSVPAGGPPFRVYIFGGKAGYDGYCSDILGAHQEQTAGLYSGLLKQLMIWNLPQRSEMFRTVLHEGFHQYLDRVCPGAIPTWFNEGSAVYYENAGQVNGSWTTGQIEAPRLEAARAMLARGFDFKGFLYGGPKEFYSRNALENYGTAWALIHFLRHSTPEKKQLFDKLFKLLCDGTAPREALGICFDDAKIDSFAEEFADYVVGLPSR